MNKLNPFLKAIAPAVLTVIAVVVDWVILGSFERQTAAIAITGLAAAIVTYFVPNTPVPGKIAASSSERHTSPQVAEAWREWRYPEGKP